MHPSPLHPVVSFALDQWLFCVSGGGSRVLFEVKESSTHYNIVPFLSSFLASDTSKDMESTLSRICTAINPD